MLVHTFIQLLPILLLILGGFTLSRLYAIHVDTLVKVIADFLMPMLIISALYTSDLEASLVFDIALSTTFIVITLTVVSFIYAKIAKIDARTFMPPMIFMNSGFLGIPLMKLWGGISAMNVIVIYDQIQTIYVFTLGIFIITGGFSAKSLTTIIRSPILWAILIGFACRFLHIPIWEPILTTLDFGGSAGPPLAAFTLGASLCGVKFTFNRHLISGLCLRIIGGFLIGLLATHMFGLTGLSKVVVLVSSSLPSAVFTSILPLRYGIRSDFAGTMVVISTLIGIVTIPLAFFLATL